MHIQISKYLPKDVDWFKIPDSDVIVVSTEFYNTLMEYLACGDTSFSLGNLPIWFPAFPPISTSRLSYKPLANNYDDI